MKRQVVLTLFCISFLNGFSQNTFTCDSLLKKDYDFWFSKADFIYQGQVIDIRERKRHTNYVISPTRAFAGAGEEFVLKQNRTPGWFEFQMDTSYVFFVFSRYKDPVFTPCVVFGKASKMGEVIERYERYCGVEPIKEDCYCPPVYDPVCGCDGYNYKNPCEAACDGVYDFFRGSCYTSTPMRVKEDKGN